MELLMQVTIVNQCFYKLLDRSYQQKKNIIQHKLSE